MKENLRLKRENEELRKESEFLKKSGGILCKENRFEAYRLIDRYQEEFGVRWLLRQLAVWLNVCYNYRKHRKAACDAQKAEVQEQICSTRAWRRA